MRSRATGEAEGARTVAEGFLRVAIANMANAIKVGRDRSPLA
jgi:hypothetical protein